MIKELIKLMEEENKGGQLSTAALVKIKKFINEKTNNPKSSQKIHFWKSVHFTCKSCKNICVLPEENYEPIYNCDNCGKVNTLTFDDMEMEGSLLSNELIERELNNE